MNEIKVSYPPLNPAFDRLQRLALAAGILAAVICVAGFFLSGPDSFFQSYLFAFLFWLGLSLGSLAIALLYYLVGGNWGRLIRRIVEAASKTIWLMALLFIPILFAIPYLYPWANAELVASDPLLQHKSAFLNIPFFILRTVIYFAVWALLAFWINRWSRRVDYFQDPERRRTVQRLSAIGLILYVLTMSFASIDWVMSLIPQWFSTIFGLLVVTTQVLAGMAFAIALLPLLARDEPASEVFPPATVRDLGALLLSVVIFWAYIAFSQFLIIWSGNLPREVIWYIQHSAGGWVWVGLAVVLAQFLLPFLVLLSLRAKRNLRLLSGLAAGITLANLVNYFWDIIPIFRPQGLSIHWLDLLTPIAIGGLWAAMFVRQLKRTPVLVDQEIDSQAAGPVERHTLV